MAPKKGTRKKSVPGSKSEPGMFAGMVVFLVESEVQPRRLQIWKQKLLQKGATIEDCISKTVTHIFAINSNALLQMCKEWLRRFKGSMLNYQWLEDSLKFGEKVSEDSYNLRGKVEDVNKASKPLDAICSEPCEGKQAKRPRFSPENSDVTCAVSEEDKRSNSGDEAPNTVGRSSDSFDFHSSCPEDTVPSDLDSSNKDLSSTYSPPDLNRNVTQIFGKLVNIYRALGDDRRSFSYHKAIPVIEKLPFKIERGDQVNHLPTIGKSMQDHIHEIVTTGKLLKLEHFETDEKVRTITLFGEVWGIGPATALKLYEKGHRTLEDLKKEDSLTNAQRLGLKYFDDIKTRIPRHEVEDMERLLQKAGQDVLPGMMEI